MRYVIVNFVREGSAVGHCACCSLPLTKSYLRELSTKLVYCADGGEECYNFHVFMCLRALEYKAREVC